MPPRPHIHVVLFAAAVFLQACRGIIGPSCVAQRQTGSVAILSGSVQTASVTTHVIPLDDPGSQHNIDIGWPGRERSDGPRLRAYATRVECEEFSVPVEGQPADTGPCTLIGTRGGTQIGGVFVQNHVTVPRDLLRNASSYKLHVVGDATERSSYRAAISWISGPEC